MGLSEGEIDQRVRRAAQFVGLKEEYFENLPLTSPAVKSVAPRLRG